MHNRVAALLGGVGLFAGLLGFVGAALAPDGGARGPWGLVMALGLIAFFRSVFRTPQRPDRPS